MIQTIAIENLANYFRFFKGSIRIIPGFKVDTFEDPIAELENYRPDLYDLLILDIKRPKMHVLNYTEKEK